MKRFIFYFRIFDHPECAPKIRVYATPVTDPARKIQELHRAGYPVHHIRGSKWQFCYISLFQKAPAGFRGGDTFLIHPERAEVLRLSENSKYLLYPDEWVQLAQYAESKYTEYLKKI